jgi:hypothetical protein
MALIDTMMAALGISPDELKKHAMGLNDVVVNFDARITALDGKMDTVIYLLTQLRGDLQAGARNPMLPNIMLEDDELVAQFANPDILAARAAERDEMNARIARGEWQGDRTV